MFLSLLDIIETAAIAVVGIIGTLLLVHTQSGQGKTLYLKRVRFSAAMMVCLCFVLLVHMPGVRVGVVAVHLAMHPPARWMAKH